METLNEAYASIYAKIEELSRAIDEAGDRISNIDTRRNEELPRRIENLSAQIQKIDEYMLKIQGFQQLAEKSLTSRNLSTVEAPEGYRVNLKRLRDWAMMIDPTASNDPYAQRVYMVAKCDECFLEKKRKEFEARKEELENDLKNGSTDEIKELQSKIAQLQGQMGELATSTEVGEFASGVVNQNRAHIYTESPQAFAARDKAPEFFYPGAVGYPFRFGEESETWLSDTMAEFYDPNTGKVFLPYACIPSEEEFAVNITCVPAKTKMNEMDAGIRNLLLNIIDKSPIASRKVYVIDGERQNTSLIGTLKMLEGSCVLESVPRNSEQISATLEQLVSTFADIDEQLEYEDSVVEYNRHVPREKQIARSLVVLVGWPDCFEGQDKNHIKRILTNYERYGISFIAVNISSEKKEETSPVLSEYFMENVVNIRMTPVGNTVRRGREEALPFLWYQFHEKLAEDYAESVKRLNPEHAGIGNEYTKRYDIDNLPPYTRAYKKLELPFGIDGKDNAHSVSFENENFATYLVGASRSGKSTLLHTLIAGIIRNYHPDNVELWLADFKQLEFKNYIEHMPPHVKYVLLDESTELVYDLIDKLTEKMMERQQLFGQMDVKRIDQVDPMKLDKPMPVIFVILDEFSIMSQSVSESQEYKLKLQNILAKGAALGIRFIFSSQTFTKGIAGLTATAKDQIQQRISMKASQEEISATLELSANLKTDQVRLWMEALPPRYALIKHRISEDSLPVVQRLYVMYIQDYTRRDRMSDRLREVTMHAVDTYEPLDINSYVDKHPVLVDGNSCFAFPREEFRKEVESLLTDEAYNGDETFVLPGVPRRMVNMKPICITPESRQNLLLIADSSEQIYCAATIQSLILSYHLQDKEVEIWSYDRNRLYRTYKDSVWAPVKKIDSEEEIGAEISRLKEQLQNRTVDTEKLVILLGFDNICSDWELMEAAASNSGRITRSAELVKSEPVKTESVQAEAVQDTPDPKEEPNESNPPRESGEDYALFASLMAADPVVDELSEEDEEVDVAELQAEILNMQNSVMQHSTEGIQKTGSNPAESGMTHTVASRGSNNARADLLDLLKQGSRQGLHFAMCLNSIADLKQTGARIELFRHRMAFQLPVEDSRTVFGSKIASELPEHVCQYSDSMDGFSFRPYLHRGMEWNGWVVEDDGSVKNIFD